MAVRFASYRVFKILGCVQSAGSIRSGDLDVIYMSCFFLSGQEARAEGMGLSSSLSGFTRRVALTAESEQDSTMCVPDPSISTRAKTHSPTPSRQFLQPGNQSSGGAALFLPSPSQLIDDAQAN